MRDAKDLIPWKVTDISLRPYQDFWSFNPSIHFDGSLWRCVLRCCDYAMPNGVTVRSKSARPTGQQTKNAMVIFDPATWKPIKIYRMHEKDDHPRASTPHVGYEDMRLFKTDKGGFQGIAASLHLRRETRWAAAENKPQHQSPEQVVVSFDGDYNIVDAKPIRGDGWSGTPQKNWSPFDACAEPRFLYAIHKGTLFDHRGSVHGVNALVRPSANARLRAEPLASPDSLVIPTSSVDPSLPPPEVAQAVQSKDRGADSRRARSNRRPMIRGGDMQIIRGKRVAIDALSSRPSSHAASTPSARFTTSRASSDSSRSMSAGRVHLLGYKGLRGGTQLVRVGDDAWLGIGHEMKFVNGKKLYWHTWYVVDPSGDMTAVSEPMKLVPNGIEFAAGLAIDGDRVVVSFGVDDMECKLGETQLSAVMEMLKQVER